MTVLTQDMRVLCVCRGGCVRSVAARSILAYRYGFQRVLACGWEANDEDTVAMLCEWADAVLVVGRGSEWKLPTPPHKTLLVDIGADVWANCMHPELHAILEPKLEAIVDRRASLRC